MINHLSSGTILRNISNIPGWRTKRHLVILESDDWGSIRMPSNKVFNNLLEVGIDLWADKGIIFNKYDSLATKEDLASLFQVLSTYKDCFGRPAVVTPVSIVANPNFARIQQSDFTEYFFEPFSETLKGYKGCEGSFLLWKEGIESRLFVPQFHGREHLNVRVWMNALKSGHFRTRQAFNNKMWGISTANDPEIKVEFQAAFDFINHDDLTNQIEVISTGLNLFEKLFGYRAKYFVPPNGPFSSTLEPICANLGIKYLFSPKIKIEPLGEGKTVKRINLPGHKSKSGLLYLTRNCFFEPSIPGKDWVDCCLNDISIAFRWHKPAVISSHRVNYIGALYEHNRDHGLAQLGFLLKKILKNWSDIEFITSDELGAIVSNEKSNL